MAGKGKCETPNKCIAVTKHCYIVYKRMELFHSNSKWKKYFESFYKFYIVIT
jgi:hypothetical protein